MWNISLAIAFSTSGWPCMQRSEVFIASSEQPFRGSLHPAQLHSKSSSKNAQTFQSIQRAASCVQHQPAKAQACLPINISNPLTTTRLETQWADCGINNLTVSEEDTCVLKPTAALRLAPLSYQSCYTSASLKRTCPSANTGSWTRWWTRTCDHEKWKCVNF